MQFSNVGRDSKGWGQRVGWCQMRYRLRYCAGLRVAGLCPGGVPPPVGIRVLECGCLRDVALGLEGLLLEDPCSALDLGLLALPLFSHELPLRNADLGIAEADFAVVHAHVALLREEGVRAVVLD